MERVTSGGLEDVIDVLADAFSGYPVMRFTAGEEGDVAARERRLVRLFVTRRAARNGPMYAVTEKSTRQNFGGAIVLTLPGEPHADAEVAEISEAAWRELGDGARARYDQYAAASNFFADYEPHIHLNMIGVRRSHTGTGLGRVLLDAVRRMAEENPGYSGVSLTTEKPANVEMYRHFGYEVIGHMPVAPGLETWGMFLRIR